MKAGLLIKVGSEISDFKENFIGDNWRTYTTSKDEIVYVRGTIAKRTDSGGRIVDESFFRNELSIGHTDLKSLKGSFSIIIVSGSQVEVYSSAFGIYHLYYSKDSMGGIYLTDDFSLYAKNVDKIALDPYTVASTAIFNFPFDDDCIVEGFKKVPAGSMLKINGDQMTVSQWYDFNWIYNEVDESIDFEEISQSFGNTLSTYTSDVRDIAVSITGGFDGRTVLSALPKSLSPLLYTFGVEESHDVLVGRKVAQKLGLEHLAYLINEDYYQNTYEDLTRYILTHANGLINHRRTHYIYAFSSLSEKVGKVFTGNVGSELFRSVSHPGLHLPPIVFHIAETQSVDQAVEKAVESYLDESDCIHLDVDSFKEFLSSRLTAFYQKEDLIEGSYLPFFKYLLRQTFSNWYGPEMSVESHWVENRAAFLDDEFVELVSKSRYGARHQSSNESNPVKRRIGQLAYSEIIKRNNRVLYKLPTSREYSPSDITSSLGLIKTSIAFAKKKFKKNVNEFNSQRTTKEFLNKFPVELLSLPEWYKYQDRELTEAIVKGQNSTMNIGAMLYFKYFANNQV